jgi:signal transduction histidine kinase
MTRKKGDGRRSVPFSDFLALLTERDDEKARAAKLLHDEVGQVLSAAGLQLGVLRLDFQQRAPGLAARITEIQDMLEKAMEQVRELSYELNPQIVERAGLRGALERLAVRLQQRSTAPIRLYFDAARTLPPSVASAVYRVAEQALDNAVRHSGGRLIRIRVAQKRHTTSLEVRDNGRGFPADKLQGHGSGIGLLLMGHFAAQAGMPLLINSTAGKGTIVRITHRDSPTLPTVR